MGLGEYKVSKTALYLLDLVKLRRVARERGRVRMVLASMWHVMVPKAPLGCLPIAAGIISAALLHVTASQLPYVSEFGQFALRGARTG